MSDLPSRVEEAARMAALWVRQHTDDWATIKREVMGELDNEHRALFGRRASVGKELPALNELELAVCSLWKRLTGIVPVSRCLAERRELKWWEPVDPNRRRGRPPLKRKDAAW